MTGAADGRWQRVKPPSGTAGYSGTPLAKKLGITAGCKVLCIDAPAEYRSLLEPIPDGVTFTSRAGAGVDLAHLFVTERGRLAKELAALPIGYVDVKVCAVSEVWSGLKVVVRREMR